MAENEWYIFAEKHWYTVAEKGWHTIAENRWYTYGRKLSLFTSFQTEGKALSHAAEPTAIAGLLLCFQMTGHPTVELSRAAAHGPVPTPTLHVASQPFALLCACPEAGGDESAPERRH